MGLVIVALAMGLGYVLLKGNNPVPSEQENPESTSTEPTSAEVASVPGAPVVTANTSFATSSSTTMVTGKVKPNGASTIYWFDYGETSALGKQTGAQSIGSGFSTLETPGFITGLRANTLYYFRLSARNSFGTVSGATYTFQTNNNPPPQGIAPTTKTISATAISRTTANLNGQIDPNGSETTYWFEYGKENDLGYVTALQSAGSGDTTTSVSISASGLEPLTKYYFRLNAQNQYGTINGSIMNFTTQGPSATTQPTVTTNSATNINSTSATLNGRISPNGVDATFWFEYSEDSLLGSLIGSGTPHQTIGSGASNFSAKAGISNLNKDTKYYYRLVGNNQYGTVYGKIDSFRTKN